MFRLMLGNSELGTSRLEAFDDGMAVATGSFTPFPRYSAVGALFRQITAAVEARTPVTQFWFARDALDLRLLGPHGARVPVESMTVYDFGDELDRELEVKLADGADWNRTRVDGGAG